MAHREAVTLVLFFSAFRHYAMLRRSPFQISCCCDLLVVDCRRTPCTRPVCDARSEIFVLREGGIKYPLHFVNKKHKKNKNKIVENEVSSSCFFSRDYPCNCKDNMDTTP